MKVSTLLTLTLIYLFIIGGIIGLCLMQPAEAVAVTLEVLPYEPPVLRGEVTPETLNPQKTISMEDL